MDARPVSGQTGLFGSARLTRRELSLFKSEMAGLDVGFTKNADRYLNNLGRQTGKHIQAGFDGNTGTVFLRKGATNFEAFHEMSHARQWAQLGTEAYKGIGKYARETHVFNQIWKNRTQFSKPELSEAINYMRRLRQSHFDNLID